ncbi:hypothetical protein AB0J55_16735 [Amycolatopsis sp. NPDC049688]|uniref:hypothetical protein n=1 Tax=Amycolatopsis sp. NPDC049688 TaxID=3154733 RepID=UPI003415308A
MPDQHPLPDAARVAHVERVHRDAAASLLAIPGVRLVALGGKEVDGRNTGELVIRVHVAAKLPEGEVPPEELIPAEIEGVRTDVIVNGGKRTIAAPPGGLVRDTSTDGQTKRPIAGGVRLNTANAPGAGTLGCVLWNTNSHDAGYALTNQHVIDIVGTFTVTKDVTEVGQPDGNDSSCCCNDIIGVYVAGERTANSDQAIVRLSAGEKWVAEIVDIGVVKGTHVLTAIDAVVNTPVRKRGARTRLTGGIVTDVGGLDPSGDLSVLVKANDNPDRKPNELLFFVDQGDSGSVLVDDDNKVCALLYARELTGAEVTAGGGTPSPLPPDGIERPKAYAYPINDVLTRFANGPSGRPLEVATATAPNQVHTVPGASTVAVPAELAATIADDDFLGEGLRAPVGRPWFAGNPPPAETVAAVRAQLARSAAGQLLAELTDRRRAEVTRLVRTDRRVAIAWHRGGGAALFQLLLRMLARPEVEMPSTIAGTPVLDVVDDLIRILSERGSPGLATDLRLGRAVLPDPAGRTLPEIMAGLGSAHVVVSGNA